MASGHSTRTLLSCVRSLKNVANQQIRQKGTSSLICKNTRCMSLAATTRQQFSLNESYLQEIPLGSVGMGKKLQEFQWNDGHMSGYPSEGRLSRAFTPRARAQGRSVHAFRKYPWGSDHQLKEFDYPSMKKNDRVLLDWLLTMETKGCAVLKNVPKKVVAGPEMIEHITFVKQSHFGTPPPVSNRTNTNSKAFADTLLGMQADLLQSENTPGIIFISCLEQHGDTGGESFIADGLFAAEILRKEHPEAFEVLSNTDPYFWDRGYARSDSGLEGFYKIAGLPMITVDNNQQVKQIAVNNAIRDSYIDLPAEKVKPFYSAMKLFNDILYDNSVVFKMDSGDIMTLDNVRCLYGSEEHEDCSKTHTELTYLNWDEARDCRRRIQEKLGSLVIK